MMFVSNRNGFKPPKRAAAHAATVRHGRRRQQRRVIGHLNLGMALHPVVLKDGRVMFSSLESQGLRSIDLWGLWSIHPDGTNWGPLVSAFMPGDSPTRSTSRRSCPTASIVVEEYYNQTNSGFGTFCKFPLDRAGGRAAFGPGYTRRPAQPAAASRPHSTTASRACADCRSARTASSR